MKEHDMYFHRSVLKYIFESLKMAKFASVWSKCKYVRSTWNNTIKRIESWIMNIIDNMAFPFYIYLSCEYKFIDGIHPGRDVCFANTNTVGNFMR
jgi:hypothetical protein